MALTQDGDALKFQQLLLSQVRSKSYTDFVIRAGDSRFPVHSLVICSQSEFFKKAISGPWKESKTREIFLHGRPNLVEALIDILYGKEVASSASIQMTTGIHSIATMYLCPSVRETTEKALCEKAQSTTTPVDFVFMLNTLRGETGSSSESVKKIFSAALKPHLATLLGSEKYREIIVNSPEASLAILTEFIVKEPQKPKVEPELPIRQLFCFNCAAVIEVVGDQRLSSCPTCKAGKFREVNDYIKAKPGR